VSGNSFTSFPPRRLMFNDADGQYDAMTLLQRDIGAVDAADASFLLRYATIHPHIHCCCRSFHHRDPKLW
jgi:hypothetical protein